MAKKADNDSCGVPVLHGGDACTIRLMTMTVTACVVSRTKTIGREVFESPCFSRGDSVSHCARIPTKELVQF